jgi:ubiquinone/menaquinone biosynthesis C-methylase UbiE
MAKSPARRAQFLPWKGAGNRTEAGLSADDLVRSTGWVFNNKTGAQLTLADFVETGDKEVQRYMRQFGLGAERLGSSTFLEIGSGIGRMTAPFTKRCAAVVAADIDAAFLERCRETVGKFGRPERLHTVHVDDGRTLRLADHSVDIAFSYITLQHCERSDALSLTREAIRVTRDGGSVILNYRSWVPIDVVLVPLGMLMRRLWRVPVVGKRLAVMRWSTRIGWQANRLSPDEVLDFLYAIPEVERRITHVSIHHSPRLARRVRRVGVAVAPLKRVNRSHWWLTVALQS